MVKIYAYHTSILYLAYDNWEVIGLCYNSVFLLHAHWEVGVFAAYNVAIGVLTTCVQTTVLVAAFDNSFFLSLLE